MFEGRKNSVTLMMTLAFAVVVLTAGARAEDKRIAVVNVSSVFSRYDKVKSVQDTLEKEFKPTQEALQKSEGKLKTWKEDIEMQIGMNGGKMDRNKKLFDEKQKFDTAMFDFQVEYEGLLGKVEDRRKNEMKRVLAEIRAAIATIGKADKFDLVLRAPDYEQDFDEIKGGVKDAKDKDKDISAQELVRRFRDNPVLYFASGVDITEKVISLLNDDFKKAATK